VSLEFFLVAGIKQEDGVTSRKIPIQTSHRPRQRRQRRLASAPGKNLRRFQCLRCRPGARRVWTTRAMATPFTKHWTKPRIGTVRYMAPEVHADRPEAVGSYSRQADIFSLGLVFYYVIEERPPRIPGVNNPTAHVAALKRGERPMYIQADSPIRRVINACTATDVKLRPVAEDVIYLVRAMTGYRSFPFCCCPKRSSTLEERERAEEIFSRLATSGSPGQLVRRKSRSVNGMTNLMET